MKHLYLRSAFVIFALIAPNIIANDKLCNPDSMDYRPFVESGKQWIVVYSTDKIYWQKNYYIAEDTVIANHSYKKVRPIGQNGVRDMVVSPIITTFASDSNVSIIK